MRPHLLPRLALLLALTGCSFSSTAPRLTLQDLLETPTILVVSNRLVVLEPALWRDLMPGPGPGVRPLIARIRVPEDAGAVTLSQVWVINGTEVWSADLDRVAGANDWMAQGGPEWGPGVNVEVVVQVHLPDRRTARVRLSAVPITAAY
jgi:hypothetical protein